MLLPGRLSERLRSPKLRIYPSTVCHGHGKESGNGLTVTFSNKPKRNVCSKNIQSVRVLEKVFGARCAFNVAAYTSTS